MNQQIKKGAHSDNFISIAGNITNFTSAITETTHTSSISLGISCLLQMVFPWGMGKLTMFPHLSFNKLLNSLAYLHIPLVTYLHSVPNNPFYTNDPTSNPHQIIVQAISKTKQQSDQGLWPANKNSKKQCGQTTNELLQPTNQRNYPIAKNSIKQKTK